MKLLDQLAPYGFVFLARHPIFSWTKDLHTNGQRSMSCLVLESHLDKNIEIERIDAKGPLSEWLADIV
jgi:hypothetical protein